jgi:hypothetical protein
VFEIVGAVGSLVERNGRNSWKDLMQGNEKWEEREKGC